MTDEIKRPANGSSSQLMIDLGPVAVFVIAYNVLLRLPAFRDNAVYIATAIFVLTTLAAIAYSLWRLRRVPPVLIVTGVIVTAFGGLTIALHDETFIKIKPTIANLFYAVAIVGSIVARENVIKLLFKHVFTLSDHAWTVLALRWAACFVGLAITNEAMRRGLSTAAWITWHFPVLMGLMVAFALANAPFLMKHHVEDASPAPSGASD
ncbi:MAG: septation protein IspZ [Proteobacteria bacterium]|nr:septation protein IspZ [Pseudomonadota bacterium]